MIQEIDFSALPAVTEPVALLGAFGMSAALGLVKTHTHALDSWVGRKLKPVQPLAIYAAAVGLPWLTDRLGIADVDPETFAAAPTATVVAITAREILRRTKGGR